MNFKSFLEAGEPSCPQCGSPMVLRTNGTTGAQFYGCTNFRSGCRGTRGYRPNNAEPKASPQKPLPKQPVNPHAQTSPVQQSSWVYAQAIKADARFLPQETLALQKQADGSWSYIKLQDGVQGQLSDQEVRSGIVQSFKKDGQAITTNKPSAQELQNILNPKPKKGHIIDDSMISDEQKTIDQKFAEVMNGEGQDHIMINALAGTGKSSTLKHLAWKYGKPGQKWLYIVFNTKNKVEASEEFPPFVEVRTTNGFLGEVLGDKKNILRMGKTDRMASIANTGKEENTKNLEKIRLIADGGGFDSLLNKYGFVEKIDPREYGQIGKTLNSLLKGIRYQFKENVVKLAQLAKAFALDPRNSEGLQTGLNKILDSYDFDTELIEIKERIANYGGAYGSSVVQYLNSIMRHDFMQKDYREEIIQSTYWMLQELMPKATKQQHRIGPINHDLSQYRDFDDDLWYAAVEAEKIQWPHYDVVLADEVQDFNEAQKIMLKKLHDAGAKIVAVGDPNQCHPTGTKITLANKETCVIENLKVGDQVLSFDSYKNLFNIQEVMEIADREYDGEMYTISTDDLSQQCTPYHKCLIQLKKNQSYYCIYLMIKDDQAQLGSCKVDYSIGFGIHTKSIQNGADRTWLLKTFDCLENMRRALCAASDRFGIALSFENYDQDKVNECLSYFSKVYEYPIWRKDYQQFRKTFVVEACNLCPEIMKIRTLEKWENFEVHKKYFEGKIYSLKVSGNSLYVANNIVTHNSIYRFRGADAKAFQNVSDLLRSLSGKNTQEFSLTKNFRSKKEILDFANKNTHVNNLQAGRKDDGKAGIVTNGDLKYNDTFLNLKSELNQGGGTLPVQTAFIARTNEPLVQTALKLLANKVPFIIVGKDIAKDLQKHVKKIINLKRMNDQDHVEYLSDNLSDHLSQEKERFFGKSTKKAYLAETEETTQALLNCIETYNNEAGDRGTIGGFGKWIAQRLGGLDVTENEKDLKKYKETLEKQNPVILTTAHKSKGLEFSRVYVLRNDQFPHPKAKRQEDLDTEENARYVAYTRARDELHILDLEDQPGYKGAKSSD